MLFDVSDNGIAGLRALATKIDETISAISGATNKLQGEIPSEGLGGWAEKVNAAIEDIEDIQRNANTTALVLQEKLNAKAAKYQELLDFNS